LRLRRTKSMQKQQAMLNLLLQLSGENKQQQAVIESVFQNKSVVSYRAASAKKAEIPQQISPQKIPLIQSAKHR